MLDHGQWVPIAFVLSWVWRARADVPYLWRKPTDWNAVREQMGYEAQPDRPTRDIPRPERKLFGWWPLRTDWDRVRREYGYGAVLEGKFRVLK